MRRLCTEQTLKNFFIVGKPHSIEEIRNHFNTSRIVAYREMVRIKALRSINKTGYYILPQPGNSTRGGLLRIEEKVFFAAGGLKEALVHLIAKSTSGMTAKDLEGKVGTNPRVQLLNLSQKGRVYREKFGGSFAYFSPDTQERKRQLDRRRAKFKRDYNPGIPDHLDTLPLELIIKILLTFIQHPDFSPKSIALSLVRRGERITTRLVESVFVKYGLCKKNS